jgi:dethiobiotin synthetase
VTVKVATILRAFRALQKKHACMVVEGVGGVHVPITETADVLDLMERMRLPAIVIGQSGLGGINQAMLTLHALRQKHIPILALVLNQLRPVRTKNARIQEQSTVNLLRRLAGVPVIGPLPYSPSMNCNWNEGLACLAATAPITKLAKLLSEFWRETP